MQWSRRSAAFTHRPAAVASAATAASTASTPVAASTSRDTLEVAGVVPPGDDLTDPAGLDLGRHRVRQHRGDDADDRAGRGEAGDLAGRHRSGADHQHDDAVEVERHGVAEPWGHDGIFPRRAGLDVRHPALAIFNKIVHEIRDLSNVGADGVAEVVMERPPVNALTTADWFDLAEAMRSLGGRGDVRVVVLRAAGRGFNAGVDIKEIQADPGHGALVAANRGCFEAFAAVYECQVPVIAAVHGFCLGGGIGLVANADVIVASDDAYFGLPEVDRGALGAATHLARLVPQHTMRALVYTAATVPVAEARGLGLGARRRPPE